MWPGSRIAQAQQTGEITDVSEDSEEINAFNLAGQEMLEVAEKGAGGNQTKDR